MKKQRKTVSETENMIGQDTAPAADIKFDTLSKRESECLHLIIRGKSARQLGCILGISQRTVEGYLNNIKSKFGVSSKAELIEVTVENMSKLNNLYMKIIMQSGNFS